MSSGYRLESCACSNGGGVEIVGGGPSASKYADASAASKDEADSLADANAATFAAASSIITTRPGSIWEHLGASGSILTTRPGIIATFLHRQLRENALQTELRSRSLFQTYLLCIQAYEVHPRQAQPSMLKSIRHSMPKQCSAVADPERAEVEKTAFAKPAFI